MQDATEGLSASEKEKVETLVAVSGAAVDEAVVRLAREDRRRGSNHYTFIIYISGVLPEKARLDTAGISR